MEPKILLPCSLLLIASVAGVAGFGSPYHQPAQFQCTSSRLCTSLPGRQSRSGGEGNARPCSFPTARYRQNVGILNGRLLGNDSPGMTTRRSSTHLPALKSSAAAADGDADDAASSAPSDDVAKEEKVPFPIVLWRFTRPHTLIGSALAIPALHLLAAPSLPAAFTMPSYVSIVFAMVPSLLMNLYITGLNQITDVEIDKINKPNLPIAAGDLSPRTATVVVLVALILSLAMGVCHPVLGTEGLNVALWGSAILGTMYSLPPFRLKRFPLLAALCIVVVRGTIINAGFFAHAKAAAFGGGLCGGGGSASVLGCLMTDPKCMLSSLFFGVFGIVIALMKDVPDVSGDEQSDIRSFSVRVGQDRVFTAMRRLLAVLFVTTGTGFVRGAILAPTRFLAGCRAAVGVASLAAGWSARKKARNVDPKNSTEVYDYYMHLWKLFYLSYLVLPFAR